jgi:hypothetical protein
MMLNMIQSGLKWVPSVAQKDFKQKSMEESFTLFPTTKPENNTRFGFFGANGFTASDVIDIVNPLHHFPIIGPLYREFTGDRLDPFSRVAGNTLFFGPFGAAFSIINVAVEEITGKDVGSGIIGMLKYKNTDTNKPQITNTNSVKPPTTTPDKNNPIDPVLAWATAEINYQNMQALKQGIDLPDRPYSNLLANATSTSDHSNQTTIASTQLESKIQTQNNNVLVHHGTLALNSLKSDRLKSPTTLQQIKRTTKAYSSVTAFIKQPSGEQPTKYIESETPISKISEAQQPVSISTKERWFSSSLNDALSKYHQAESSTHLSDKGNIPIGSTLP